MASAEVLKMTHVVDSKVMGVDDRVQGVEEKVQDVRDDVHDVRNKVGGVEGRVQTVDDKIDQANRSSFVYFLLPIPSIHAASQGPSSERIFYDGFRPQIHPPIITLHATFITTAQLNGFFKELYSINGNPLGPSCGYMESVRYSQTLLALASDHLLILQRDPEKVYFGSSFFAVSAVVKPTHSI